LSDRDVTLARLLRSAGYLTGLFGQYRLGDRNEFLPTVQGLDEFPGNFYALRTHFEGEES
jgi:arylsulfatase